MGLTSSRSQVEIVDGSLADTASDYAYLRELRLQHTRIENDPEKSSSLTEEVKSFVEARISSFHNELAFHRQAADESNLKYENLRQEHTRLQQEYEKLVQSGVEVRQVSSKISEQAVDDYVKKIFSDPASQHGYITDAVEGVVYRRALKAMLHAVAHAADSSNFQFVGHQMVFGIEPIPLPPSAVPVPETEIPVPGFRRNSEL